jgi:8-oxo-dGTP diphosphatase
MRQKQDKAKVHVSVGLIQNSAGYFFLSCRRPQSSHAGLWEFPGGKRKPKESSREALARELKEEVGIAVLSADYLGTVYPTHHNVILDMYHVTTYDGNCHNAEQQVCAWVKMPMLYTLPFPYAHPSIIKLLERHKLINKP